MNLVSLTLFCACQPRALPPPAPRASLPGIGVTRSAPGQNAAVGRELVRTGLQVLWLDPPLEGEAAKTLASLDGLVLGGGVDLDPALYGEAPHPSLTLEHETRQAMDMALARAALEARVPTLGICLGAQELAVASGGSLVQDIPSELPDAMDHYAPHAIALTPGTLLAQIYEAPQLDVVSFHHQAADELGPGLTPAAWAPDGVLEAFYAPERHFLLGLQYHPEREQAGQHSHEDLWAAFAAAAREHAGNRQARARSH